MENLKKFALGMTVFFCGGSVAMAQPTTSVDDWYFSPSINWVKPDTGFGVDKHDIGGALRFGKYVAPNLDVQLGGSYAGVDDRGIDYKQYLLGADALYLFTRSNFRPFLLAGIGAQYDKRDGGGRDVSKTSPYINVGLGFQYSFNNSLALQADYRRVRGFINENDFGFNRSDNDYLNLGVNFTFGRH
jgi:OOP family OmpA-OmpF porin